MKKQGYCRVCDYEFSYDVKCMDDLTSVCPKCGNKCSGKKYVSNTKLERNVGNVAYVFLKFYSYFYLIFSLCGIFSYFLNFHQLLVICSIIMTVFYLLELLLGYTRNVFGVAGFIVSIMIGLFINNICLCLTIMFLVSSMIRLLYRLIVRYLFRKYG